MNDAAKMLDELGTVMAKHGITRLVQTRDGRIVIERPMPPPDDPKPETRESKLEAFERMTLEQQERELERVRREGA